MTAPPAGTASPLSAGVTRRRPYGRDWPHITKTVTNVNGIVTKDSGSYASTLAAFLMYVNGGIKLTYMEKTQVYLRKEELDALRKAAARSRRSVAALVREAIRKVVLPPAEGPVAIWDGEPKRSSIEHDSVYDEP